MDPNGDRMTSYAILDMDPTSGEFQVCINQDIFNGA